MTRTLIFLGFGCWFSLVFSAQATGQETAVTTARRTHPLLIRNDAGPLLQIVVDVPANQNVRLQKLHFNLDGTDDVNDLESLSLFATGAKPEFAPALPVGKPIAPAPTFALGGDLPLSPGKNTFWLSCRLKPTADLAHKVRAVCTAVETTAGKLPVKDLSPTVRQRIGVALRKHKDDGVHTYRIPALTRTPKGTLLCVYDMRRRMGRDLQEDIDIGLSRSTDGGKTWEAVRVIMDMGKYGGLPQEQNGCSDPGIIVDRQTGEIFCFAVWMHGNPGKHQWRGDGSAPGYEIGKAAQMLMVSSKDDGRTWTKPVNLTRTLKQASWWLLAPAPQSGIYLPDGTLVMPIQGRDDQGVPFATIMSSKDHGQSWTVGAQAYSGGNECQAVQLGDGAIMLNMRNDRDRYRAVFVTKDLGQTWQAHETNRKALIEPNCNGSLLRVDYLEAGAKKHVLLFSNPHTQKGRTHQTIQVSFDDGRTWPASHHLLLDEGRGAGYPSLTRVDEGHVGIVYEGSQAHLVFEKIPLAELLKTAAQSALPGPKGEVSFEGEAQSAPEKGYRFRVESNLRAGVAKVDITPPPDTPVVGHVRPTNGVRDPIRAGVLLLDNGHTRAAIVTLDLINAPTDMVAQLREAIADRTKTPPKNILVAASHNHSGPGWSREPGWGRDMVAKVVAAAAVAAKDLRPVTIGYGEDRIDFNINRRKVINGRAVVRLNPDGPCDHRVKVLRCDDGQTLEPMAVLMHAVCHPCVFTWGDKLTPPYPKGFPKISADFPGEAQTFVEQVFGPRTCALFLQGCAGDIRPNLPGVPYRCGDEADIKWTGRSLGCAVVRALDRGAIREELAKRKTIYPLRCATSVIELPGKKAKLACEMQALRVGDFLLLTIPGEPMVEYGFKIEKAIADRAIPIVIGYANGHLGYICTAESHQYGGYEPNMSPLLPEAEALILAEAGRLADRVLADVFESFKPGAK